MLNFNFDPFQKYKFDRKETYPIGDVLICHTDKRNVNCVVWVVRIPVSSSHSSLEALVFECFGEENVKDLYRKFLEVSKRSKLERHRRRRSDGGGSFSGGSLIEDIRVRDTPAQQQQRRGQNGLWNLVRHTDRNGITHIEVESQRRKNGDKDKPPISVKKPSEKSKFAKELESILSKELENRRIGSASPGSTAKIWGPRSTGEPQSLRQRAPALLLRKLDEFEEMAHRVWGNGSADTAEGDSDNRKVWQRPEPSKGASRTPPPSSRRHHEVDNRRRERLERLRVELMHQKSEAAAGSQKELQPNNLHSVSDLNGLGVASHSQPTLPTPTTTTTTTTTVTSLSTNAPPLGSSVLSASTGSVLATQAKKEGEKQILIPTKTGKEPVRKLYPKESPPDQIRTRFVPVAIPIQVSTKSIRDLYLWYNQ